MNTSSSSKFTVKDKLFAHLETWRIYTVIWCGLVSLAGTCIAFGSLPSLRTTLLVLFIPMMGWTAGLYLSDYLDQKLDSIQKPHRPIPSGRIKPTEALMIGAIFAITGFGLSFLLSLNNIILVFVVALLVFLYSKISKSKGIVGNLNRGLITVAAYFFGVFSLGQSISSIPIYIWLLAIVFLFHDTNSNLIGAIRDIKGDKEGGYNTFPVKYGIKKSILLSLILTLIWLPFALYIPYRYNFLKTGFYIVMILDIIILLVMYIYLFRFRDDYSQKKSLRFHEFFVVERVTLASAFIFGITEYYIAGSVFAIALLVTIVSQLLLRKRYEFKEKTQ